MSGGEPTFYVTGGTLHPDAPSYVERDADQELFASLKQGEFCYVLTSRQMGKSSLMVRTVGRLRREEIAVGVLDLTAIGQNVTVEQWYDGLTITLGKQFRLEDELDDFWRSQSRLGPLQRWVLAIEQVILHQLDRPVVIFIDEIDIVRSLPFSTDEFFAALRECYNRRGREPVFQRLTFCLLGVATPSDLIRDTRLTPFNIGRRIELDDFSQAEALAFARGWSRDERVAGPLLERVWHWTHGHPYLTQRLCRALADDPAASSPADVDRRCEDLFLSAKARDRDDNLIFVRERLLRAEADRAALLSLYAQIHREARVPDDETNPLVSLLRLAGVVRGEGGRLCVRNRIYQSIFDQKWARANLPDAEVRRQRAAFRRGVGRALLGAGLVLILALALATYQRPRKVHVFADGSTLTLNHVSFGKHHRFEPGRFRTAWISELFPVLRPFLLKGGLEITTPNDTCVVGLVRRGSHSPQHTMRPVLVDDSGAEIEAGVSQWSSASSEETIKAWHFPAFPRRQSHFALRIYGLVASNQWNRLAEFRIKNEKRTTPQDWTPEALPIAKSLGDFSFSLERLVTGAGPTHPTAVGPGQSHWTWALIRLLSAGRATGEWGPVITSITDATGNEWPVAHAVRPEPDADGLVNYRFPGDLLLTESAFRIEVEFSDLGRLPPRSGFSQSWVVTNLVVPAPGVINQLRETTDRYGSRFELLGMAGTGTVFPGGAPWEDGEGPSVHVRFQGGSNNLTIDLARVTDERGVDITVTGWNALFSDAGKNVAFGLGKTTAQSVTLHFNIHRQYTAVFTAKPERAGAGRK